MRAPGSALFPRNGLAGFSRVVLMGALALSVCIPEYSSAHGKKSAASTKVSHHKVSHHKQVGKASWYGPGLHGKKTASGETFNQNKLTAAHRSLPLGTKAKVTNLENGKKVEVTITDRGPRAGNRAIDLSRAAANKLDMKEDGTARVKIEAKLNPKKEPVVKLDDRVKSKAKPKPKKESGAKSSKTTIEKVDKKPEKAAKPRAGVKRPYRNQGARERRP